MKENKYLMLEAAISTLGTLIAFNKDIDKEHTEKIIEGLKEFRYKEPEITTLDKIIAREREKSGRL